MNGTRAVSSVISVVLMVAVVVVLAATVSAFAFDFTENFDDPAPNVAQSTGEFVPQDGNSGGIVTLRHVAGDCVAISDTEIAVRAE